MNGDQVKPGESMDTRIAVLEERIRGMAAALQLQASKYEDRLQDLNHAHAKQVQDQSTYISQDRFEGFLAETHVWRAKIDKALDGLEGRYSGVNTAREIGFKAAPIVLSIATLVLLLLRLK